MCPNPRKFQKKAALRKARKLRNKPHPAQPSKPAAPHLPPKAMLLLL